MHCPRGAEALEHGFLCDPYLERYSYRKMMGGALRRKMIGELSQEELLAEAQLTCQTQEEFEEFKRELEEKVAEYRGKYKEFPEVKIGDVMFYPKDGSFSRKKDA
jgi:hypothetical protein